jgi:hypothetical protein
VDVLMKLSVAKNEKKRCRTKQSLDTICLSN